MKIDSLDHRVLTVKNIETTCAFYSKISGMEVIVNWFGQLKGFGAGQRLA